MAGPKFQAATSMNNKSDPINHHAFENMHIKQFTVYPPAERVGNVV